MLVYVAGPLFSTHERRYLEEIASKLEVNGFQTFLPHRDAGLLDGDNSIDRQDLFQADLKALKHCEIIVALLTGPDHDSGTCAELGIAFAQNKLCFGITDDMRWLNNMIWGICDQGRRIATSPDKLVAMLLSFTKTSQSASENGLNDTARS